MNRFAKDEYKALVVGDIMLDSYIYGSSSRVSPEAPVVVLNVKSESDILGGACNVVNNLISLGMNTAICGVIGDDKDGANIVDMLRNMNVDIAGVVVDKSRRTTKKTRVVASSQQIVRVDNEDVFEIDSDIENVAKKYLKEKIGEVDIVVISDYSKGFLTKNITRYTIEEAKKQGKKVLVDPKGVDYEKYTGAYLLTPNKKEASVVSSININNEETLRQSASYIQKKCNLNYLLITLSEDGIALFDKEKLEIFEAFKREVFDVTGAGDTVIAILAYMLARDVDIKEAIRYANIGASIVIGKTGSATATLGEIENFMEDSSFSKVISMDSLKRYLTNIRLSGKKIVFTNGCFDILHKGHVDYLNKARKLGDLLILGLNSDASVRRLKGEDRPINDIESRASVLNSMSCIDFIVVFEEDTPLNIIKEIKPDILVKGADYKDKEVVGSKFAKEVSLIEYVEGKSTTNIINKILKIGR